MYIRGVLTESFSAYVLPGFRLSVYLTAVAQRDF